MKIRLNLAFVVLLTFSSAPALLSADNTPHWVKTSRQEWKSYVHKKFPIGTSAQKIDAGMKGKYIAKIKWPYPQGGIYDVSYRVDDITEVVFNFNKEGLLNGVAAVIPHRVWVRNPTNGNAWIIMEKKDLNKKQQKPNKKPNNP